MTAPAILGIGTALPEAAFDQMEICRSFEPAFNNRRAPALFRATQIETRFLAQADIDWYLANPSNAERLAAYNELSPLLGISAVELALDQAELTPQEIDTFFVTSSSGVDSPGLDVKIADGLAMSPFLRRAALVGMGCQAVMPSLYHAVNELRLHPERKVLILAVELCTLHIQHNRGVKNILGSALFSDGASAAVVGVAESGPQVLDMITYSDYGQQEDLSFHPGNTGYQIYLSGRIPNLLREKAPPVIEQLLAANRLTLDDIKHWVVYPGGIAVLDALEEVLDLREGALDAGRHVLRRCGNMSSATLLFVLERLVQEEQPRPGEYGILLGFGPGMTIEAGLIRW